MAKAREVLAQGMAMYHDGKYVTVSYYVFRDDGSKATREDFVNWLVYLLSTLEKGTEVQNG